MVCNSAISLRTFGNSRRMTPLEGALANQRLDTSSVLLVRQPIGGGSDRYDEPVLPSVGGFAPRHGLATKSHKCAPSPST